MSNTNVDRYIEQSDAWPDEMKVLRVILLDCGLTEEIKWNKPCYSHDGRNIAIMQEMKGFLALMFFKGALLNDPDGVLHAQGPNSRSALRMQFTSTDEVARQLGVLRKFVGEAIDNEDAGREVGPAPAPVLVEELTVQFGQDPELKKAFEALTPGRQREYNLYFSSAKQAATRTTRVEKYADKIRDGRGFRDR